MQPLELGVRRRLGSQPGSGTDLAQQIDPRTEAPGAQRVARPEVVVERSRAENQ